MHPFQFYFYHPVDVSRNIKIHIPYKFSRSKDKISKKYHIFNSKVFKIFEK